MISIMLHQLKALLMAIKKINTLETIIIEKISFSFTLSEKIHLTQLPKIEGVVFTANNTTLHVSINTEKI